MFYVVGVVNNYFYTALKDGSYKADSSQVNRREGSTADASMPLSPAVPVIHDKPTKCFLRHSQ